MNTASRPAIQATAPPREDGVPGTRARDRAASAVRVTGLTLALCPTLARGRLWVDPEWAQYAAVYAQHELEDEVRVVGGEHVGAG